MNGDSPDQPKERRGCPPGKGVVVMPNGSRIGTPPHVPTDEQRRFVRLYASVHPQWIIAEKINVSVDTLQKHYRKELTDALFEKGAAVSTRLLQDALKPGNTQAQLAWLRQFVPGWSEKRTVEITGRGGGPIEFDLSPFLQGKSEHELAILEEFLVNITPVADHDEFGDEGGGAPPSP